MSVRMQKARMFASGAIVLLLSGCASMQAQVDILQPSYVTTSTEEIRERDQIIKLSQQSTLPREQALTKLVEDLIAVRVECYNVASKAIAEKIASQSLTAVELVDYNAAFEQLKLDASDEGLSQSRQIMRDYYRDQFAKIDADAFKRLPALTAFFADVHAPIPLEARSAVLEQSAGYARLARTALNEQARCDVVLKTRAQISVSEVHQHQVEAFAAKLAARPPSVFGDGIALTSDANAYYVASAPESQWLRKFNIARGNASFGSSDIVVKLNQAADFTIKGFTFDARSTADMVSKAGVAAIKLLAASYGMPLPAGASGAANPSVPDAPGVNGSTTSGVMGAEVGLAVAQARSSAYREVLRSTANMILANWSKLTSGDGPSQAALRASFDSTKNAWKGNESVK